MARVYRVNKSRKPRRCHKGHEIPTGSSYTYSAPGFRGREIYACTEHPFRQSDLMTGLAREPQAAREALQDTLAGIDTSGKEDSLQEIRDAWEEFTSALQEYVDARQEGLDAWENGNDMLQELLDIAETALQEAESFEVEDGPDEPEEVDEPGDEPGMGSPEEEIVEWDLQNEAYANYQDDLEQWESEYESHVEAQIEAALEVAEGLEF